MIGIDTVNVERFRSMLGRSPGIEERLFSHNERDYCRAKADPVMHFAGTLAAKEAVIKARGLGPLVAWSRRIEITRAESGAPIVTIKGASHDPVHLSISHDGPVAVAVAFAPVLPGSRDESKRAQPPRRTRELKSNPNLQRYLAPSGFSSASKSGGRLALASELVEGSDFP